MPRTTLALPEWLTCFSASFGDVVSAVTWSCVELFNYLLHENQQEVMQKVRFFVPKPRIARRTRMVRGTGWMAKGGSTSLKAMAKTIAEGANIRRQSRSAFCQRVEESP
jgi:hypothetical protein